MIRLKEAVVVEGRYDKGKLDSIVDALVITTDGFNIFRNAEKQQLIRRLSRERGLLVLTDNDVAGFKIRKFVSDLADGKVCHVYIPQVKGKEGRKAHPGAEGLLGVEGMDVDVLRQALLRFACKEATADERHLSVTAADLYQDGFIGTEGAKERKKALLRAAGFPERISVKMMLRLLNDLYAKEGYRRLTDGLNDRDD